MRQCVSWCASHRANAPIAPPVSRAAPPPAVRRALYVSAHWAAAACVPHAHTGRGACGMRVRHTRTHLPPPTASRVGATLDLHRRLRVRPRRVPAPHPGTALPGSPRVGRGFGSGGPPRRLPLDSGRADERYTSPPCRRNRAAATAPPPPRCRHRALSATPCPPRPPHHALLTTPSPPRPLHHAAYRTSCTYTLATCLAATTPVPPITTVTTVTTVAPCPQE